MSFLADLQKANFFRKSIVLSHLPLPNTAFSFTIVPFSTEVFYGSFTPAFDFFVSTFYGHFDLFLCDQVA